MEDEYFQRFQGKPDLSVQSSVNGQILVDAQKFVFSRKIFVKTSYIFEIQQ